MSVCTPYADIEAGRITVHTAATRPTGSDRYEGKWIYETDTDRTLFWDGTGWVIMAEPTQTYTPTWTNLSSTTPTVDFRYHRQDGYCEIVGRYVLGSAPSVTGLIGFSTPSGADNASITSGQISSWSWIVDTGTASFPAFVLAGTTTRFDLYTANAASAASAASIATAAGSPMTWVATDVIHVGVRYRMTNRYT
jgi:hypothetical protein